MRSSALATVNLPAAGALWRKSSFMGHHYRDRAQSARDGNRAAWWRENAPHLIAPKRYLVFHEEVCRIADI
jgi:hypothetical protein